MAQILLVVLVAVGNLGLGFWIARWLRGDVRSNWRRLRQARNLVGENPGEHPLQETIREIEMVEHRLGAWIHGRTQSEAEILEVVADVRERLVGAAKGFRGMTEKLSRDERENTSPDDVIVRVLRAFESMVTMVGSIHAKASEMAKDDSRLAEFARGLRDSCSEARGALTAISFVQMKR